MLSHQLVLTAQLSHMLAIDILSSITQFGWHLVTLIVKLAKLKYCRSCGCLQCLWPAAQHSSVVFPALLFVLVVVA